MCRGSMMKKVFLCVVLAVLVLASLTGCDTEFATEQYDDVEAIAGNTERTVKIAFAEQTSNEKYVATAGKFSGRQTLGERKFGGDVNVEVLVNMNLSEGKAKVVLVDGNGNVSTIVECTPDNTEGSFSGMVKMTAGTNKIKLIGADAKDLNISVVCPIIN